MSGRPAPSLALLSAITALAFCGLHMVVPALPLLVVVFGDTPAHVQLVVSLYLAGIGPQWNGQQPAFRFYLTMLPC